MRIFLFLFLLISLTAKTQGIDTVEQNLKKAQTAYYQNQIKTKPFWDSLTPTLPSILGTMIGASLALFGVRWSNAKQWKLEKEKWEKAKADESLKEVKYAAANLTKIIAAEIQAIIWLTWIAKFDSETLSDKDIDDYNQEMKKLFKEDLIAQAYLAALDTKLYHQMKVIVKEISNMDHNMSFSVQKFKQAGSKDAANVAAMNLGEFYDPANSFYNNIPEKIGNILPSIK